MLWFSSLSNEEYLTPEKEIEVEPIPQPEVILIEELQLPVRAYNCLKRAGINSVDEFSNSLINMTQIIKKSKFNKNKLENDTNGNILATDIADLLAIKGVPFREAHIKVSDLTNKLNKQDKVLSDLSPADLKEMLKIDFYLKINLFKSINSRKLKGGTATAQVRKEIITAKKSLNL